MSQFDGSALLRSYKEGVGFRHGDILTPKEGAKPDTFEVIENKVVVLEQNSLAPHMYTVVGEHPNPQTPSDRFVEFEIDGHDWQKIGHA